MLVTSDEKLKGYISNVLSQLSEWIMRRRVQKLVLVISGADSNETMERWVFNIEPEQATLSEAEPESDKKLKEVMAEIQAIIRQITASVTFLPLLDEPCTFDLLVYTDEDVQIPLSWEESDPRYINNSAEVRLRSFTTKIHKGKSASSYPKNLYAYDLSTCTSGYRRDVQKSR